MPRSYQERLLSKVARIICVCMTILMLVALYQFLPKESRLIIIPGSILIGWSIGSIIGAYLVTFQEMSFLQRMAVMHITMRVMFLACASLVVVMLQRFWSIEDRMLGIPLILLAAWEVAELASRSILGLLDSQK